MIAAHAFSPSLILLLQLLFLTSGGQLLRANAAALAYACRQTKEPRRCESLLTSSDPRSPTASFPVLAQIAIDEATYTAGQNKIKFHNLFLSAKNRNLKAIYGNCENLYSRALDALLIAPEYLQQRKYPKLIEAARIVGRAVGGSAAAVEKNVALKRENEDVGVVAQAIDVIAKTLQRR